ncbi:MAG: hypothetical protein LH606_13220 [Cytophagaceae bacterium]|nr:hypothetical protein [Cytophagaceae bacterium]
MPQASFSPSVNIIRDAGRPLTYYPTDNTRRVVSQLIADYHTGIRAFTLIGSYGTGKSAFLWALEQNLLAQQPYFRPTLFGNGPTEVLRVVGEYASLSRVLAQRCGLAADANSTDILAELYAQHQTALTTGRLVVLVDEFGKFLEHAAQHDPGASVYFLQELAEFANDPRHNALLLTTVHQNVDAYAFGLSKPQQHEWSKVKGRFREITFNEPVEQLLRLAATHLQHRPTSPHELVAVAETVLLATDARAFDLSPAYASEVAEGLFPLDILAANVLTICLQRYGQNERSLFSFLQASDHTSLKRAALDNGFYHLGHVYDYLFFNFYTYLHSKYNPDYAAWSAIRGSLEEIERVFGEAVSEYSLLLKTIGLLNLTAARGSGLTPKFLTQYARTVLGIAEAGPLIESLKRSKIILYKPHAKRFVPNNGTDLDVEAALIEVADRVERSNAVATLLKRYDDLPPVLAKAYTFATGTPRLFEFVITDELRADQPSGEADGFIYLIFNESLTMDAVRAFSAAQSDALLYVHYANVGAITDLLFELEKLQQVKADNVDDRVAVRLIEESIGATRNTLNHLMLGQLYNGSAHLRWVWQGAVRPLTSKRTFNQLLTEVCQAVYPDAPTFWNELVNKHRISNSIFTARRNYLKALVAHWDKPELGFEKSKFPPEKTIYLTLLKANGISTYSGNRNEQHPDPNRFGPLWAESEAFLTSAKDRRRRVSGLYERLSRPPFKLKQGFLDFWVPTYLFLKRDDFALFGEKGYVPQLSDETLDLVIKYPDAYEIKAFDIEGVKLDLFNSYRTFLQQQDKLFVDNSTFIETIRPFLSFYRQLPEYAKHTRRLSKEALAIRAAITTATDLEKTFFEDFPTALGYTIQTLLGSSEQLAGYIQDVEQAVREIRHCYAELLSRFEQFIQRDIVGGELPFTEYKAHLQARYARLSSPLLMPNQRVFVQRLNSATTDRDAWLNAMAQAVLGKALDLSRDDDERVLYERFRRMLTELDGLTNLSTGDVDPEREVAWGVDISSFGAGVQKRLIRVPKTGLELNRHAYATT